MKKIKSRIAIIGSGLASISFCYALSRHLTKSCDLFVLAGEEVGLENHKSQSHGFLNATNYSGLGGTTKIWGRLCRPYELGPKTTEIKKIDWRIAAECLGVQHAETIWTKEQISDADLSKVFFARACDGQDNFWTDSDKPINEHLEISLFKNVGVTDVHKNAQGKWELKLKGNLKDTFLSEIDILVIAAGFFNSPAIIINSPTLRSRYVVGAGVDHRITTIGTATFKKIMQVKNIIGCNEQGKWGYVTSVRNHSVTVYLEPHLHKPITGSRSQDRVLAISILRRPLECLARMPLLTLISFRAIHNAYLIAKSYLIGTSKFDIVTISEEKANGAEVREYFADDSLYDELCKRVQRHLLGRAECTFFERQQAQKEALSALHRTGSVKSLNGWASDIHHGHICIDASALQITSSINPGLTIAAAAAMYARKLAKHIGNA